MFFKLAVLACVAVTTLGQHWNGAGAWHSNSPHRNDPIPPGIPAPAQYPAGVDAHACPNYPHCNNPSVATGQPANAWNGGWNGGNNGGQWNGGNNGAWMVLACVAVTTLGQHWNGAGAWHSNSPHRNDPIPPGIPAPAQYPAGVDAHACPNYPHCNNPSVATGQPANAWNGGWNGGNNGGQWNGGNNGAWNGGNNGQWNGGNQWGGHNNALDAGEYTGDGDYHGEGLQEAGAYGDVSQNWNDNNGQWNGGNQGGWNGAQAGAWNGAQAGAWNGGQAAQLPAGVDAHQCPNYPYCH